jgi:potassium efflux system protein
MRIDAGARFAIAALLRYAILIVGFILAFDAIGIGWRQVQWLAAAMTVGLAFGLQEIFANFVSGIIVLFERPIRIGDVVTVGNVDGKITRISMRATHVTDWNRRELIVPNKTFVTNEIINWTLSDPVTRVVVPVGIAYGSNTRLARDLLLKAARACGPVLHEPVPMAIFKGFGDSALDFELRVFIPSRDIWPEMMDELHTRIDDEFRQAGIEIAFPQRDVHVRSVHDVLPIVQGGERQPSDPLPPVD